MKRVNLPKLIFFALLFFLPQQFGPHFWPPFSYVYGIRLDYLSPTLYISDILIILLLVFSAKKVFSSKQTQTFIGNKFFLLFVLVLFVPLLYASQPLALLYGFLKIFEFFYLGLYIATQLTKKDLKPVIAILTVTALLESLLAVVQFITQGSVGGPLYFVGERLYSLSSLGIAAMNTSHGLAVRPYGTFSHPNVLAFFLFVGVVFSSYGMHNSKGKLRYALLAAIICIEAGLFLTFSRTILLVNILFLLYAFGFVTIRESGKKIRNIFFAGFLVLFTILYLTVNNLRFLAPSEIIHSVIPRQDLVEISLSAIQQHPLFGLGLNNFYYYEGTIQTEFTSVYLQPVHNIFLLIASQVGIVGLSLFLYFLLVVTQSAWKHAKHERKIFSCTEVPLVLVASLIFVGMFDHFFLTVQQGELMLALILGLSFSKAME